MTLSRQQNCAEHNMLVDLGRNDLGKICDFGTVEVEKAIKLLNGPDTGATRLWWDLADK